MVELGSVEFGGVEQVKEECRDERRWQLWSTFGRDLRIGWRMPGLIPRENSPM